MDVRSIISDISIYLNSLHLYDFLAYGWIFILFIFFIIIAVISRKNVFISIFFVLLSLCTFFILPLFVKEFMDGYIRKGEITTESIVRFSYAQRLVAKGEVTNKGKKEFSKCIVKLSVIKPSDNELMKYINMIKPIRSATAEVEGPIGISESKPFKVHISSFTTTKDYNTTIKARCY